MGLFGFGGDKDAPRSLDRVDQLQVGDIVSFKDRPPVPPDVQGVDFEVTAVEGYQYSDGSVNEFTLKSADNLVIVLSEEIDDGETSLCLGRQIRRKQVLRLFDEDQFADLWEPEFAELDVVEVPGKLTGWVGESYRQVQKEATAFYYDRDLREDPASEFEDDGGAELRYHECLSDDEDFGVSVEIFADGETDVYLQAYLPEDVISGLWPAEETDE